jgi:hypothetical protein
MADKSPKEKIAFILSKIKEQFDITPKGKLYPQENESDFVRTSDIGDAGVKVNLDRLLSSGLNYFDIKGILEKLVEEGFISLFDYVREYRHFQIIPSQDFKTKYASFIEQENQMADKNIVITTLLDQQYSQRNDYLENPLSDKGREWSSRTQQLINKVDSESARRFSEYLSLYESIKSKPYSKMGEKETISSNLIREILTARDYLALSDENINAPQKEKLYKSGDKFSFLRDVMSILENSKREVLIVDPYLDDGMFAFLMGKLSDNNINIKILISDKSKLSKSFTESYSRSHPKNILEIKKSSETHDRILIIDGRAWVIGQSIKDGANEKPTYIVELNSSSSAVSIAGEYLEIFKKGDVF